MESPGRLPFALAATLVFVLLVSGGASRPDMPAQIVTRFAAWLALVIMIIWNKNQVDKAIFGPVLILFGAVAAHVVQLIPLPPEIWSGLPGREVLSLAASSAGELQPWRPITMSPNATINSLSALIVPATIFLLIGSMPAESGRRLTGIVLLVITIGALLGLGQYSGADIRVPLVNFVAGDVSGPFANRNHFALFVAIGCLLTPVWVLQDPHIDKLRLAGLGLLPLFVLVLLATGSRMGVAIGGVAIILGFLIVRHDLDRIARVVGARSVRALLAGLVATCVAAIVLSSMFGRAASLDRLMNVEASSDLRLNTLPTVVEIVRTVFPVGSGFGTFDPVYRIWEPKELLSYAYLNRAHNDFVEVAMDGGIVGILLLLAAITWWAVRSFRVWRTTGRRAMAAKAGSAVLFMVMVASITDYPARTPMIMALVAISACWLASPSAQSFKQEKSQDGI